MFWKIAALMSLISAAFVAYPVLGKGMNRSRYLFMAITALSLLVIPVLIYIAIGSSSLIAHAENDAKQPMNHPGAGQGNLNLEGMAIQLERKLEANPENLDGWVLLAKTYYQVQQYPKALLAFKRAVNLAPNDANLLADYADIMVLSNNGVFDSKSEKLIEQAVLANPEHPKALMLKATVLFNHKDYKGAISIWKKLLKVEAVPESIKVDIRANIEEASKF